ncbi:GNAT family N-acetyltransferase [Labrenzia sp. PHM005]|nr:GNAT family N-acetyltransferase [Labrenzia sp. PHM005]
MPAKDISNSSTRPSAVSRSWQIVLGSPANRRDILKIFRKCREDCGEPFEKAHEAAISRMLVDASAGRIYLVEVRGVPAGFACVAFQQSVIWAGRLAILEKIYPLNGYKGQGLAQRILRAIIGDLENFGPAIVTAYLREGDPLSQIFELEGFSAVPLVRFTDQEFSENDGPVF